MLISKADRMPEAEAWRAAKEARRAASAALEGARMALLSARQGVGSRTVEEAEALVSQREQAADAASRAADAAWSTWTAAQDQHDREEAARALGASVERVVLCGSSHTGEAGDSGAWMSGLHYHVTTAPPVGAPPAGTHTLEAGLYTPPKD